MSRCVILLGLLMIVPGCSPSEEQGKFPNPAKLVPEGKLPASWAVTGLDGKEVTTEDLRGKVVFINRWATWCGPCIMEMPSIQALYESLQDSNIVFLIVSAEKEETVKKFVQKRDWTLPIYLATEGLPPALHSQVIPVTFIVNSKGEVVHRHDGVMNWDTNEARKFLKAIP